MDWMLTFLYVSHREKIPLSIVGCIEIEIQIQVVFHFGYLFDFSQVSRLKSWIKEQLGTSCSFNINRRSFLKILDLLFFVLQTFSGVCQYHFFNFWTVSGIIQFITEHIFIRLLYFKLTCCIELFDFCWIKVIQLALIDQLLPNYSWPPGYCQIQV